MHFLKRILSKFWSLFQAGVPAEDVSVFPKIDPERIAKELKIVETARRRGEQGIPYATDTQLSDVERSIRGRLGKIRESLIGWATTSLKINQDRLNSIDITLSINRAAQLADEYERNANQIIAAQEGELSELRKIAQSSAQELDAFKQSNRLMKEAKIKSGSTVFLNYAVLLAMVIVEGFVNAKFFADGLSDGLIGGFIYAGLLSFTNVMICWVIGRLAIHKNHVSIGQKLLGYLSLLFILIWSVVMGLVTAHIRDALLMDLPENQSPWVLAKETLINAPVALHDVTSYILCCLTIIFGFLAAFKGFYWTDVYPGFARMQKAYEQSQRNYIFAIESLRQDLENKKERVLENLDSVVNDAAQNIANFKRNIHAKQVIKKRLDEGMILADETLQELVQKYRIENDLARPEGFGRPSYFNDPVEFEVLQYPEFDSEKNDEKLAVQEELMVKMTTDIEDIRARIQASFTYNHNQLQPLTQIV